MKKNLIIIALSLLLLFLILEYIEIKNLIPLSDSYVSCLENNSDSYDKGLCLKKLAEKTVGIYTILKIDEEISKIKENEKLQWCHEFMHYAGWSLYNKTNSLYDAFQMASSKCDSGQYHGIVEQFINKVNIKYDSSQFVEKIIDECYRGISDKKLPMSMQGLCFHGLGHGFMFITDNDLPKSLKLCDKLPSGFAYSCYSGSYMENIQSKQVGRNSSHVSKFSFDKDDPDYPCNTLEENYKEYCYKYKGISNVVKTQGDFEKSFEMCLGVDKKYIEVCFFGVGSDIPGPFWSSKEAGEKCDSALAISKVAYKQCIFGGMSFLLQVNVGDPISALEYCRAIRDEYKNLCYQASGMYFKSWLNQSETLEDKCGVFDDESAQKICLAS
ncbi:MAG: hypothetical protein WAX44_00005 [Minisyncoccia bacterium]